MTHVMQVTSSEMEAHLKEHEQRRMASNVVVRKLVHKGSVMNFEECVFFQGTKVPKHSLFSRLFSKRKARFIILNQDFWYTLELVPHSLRMGKVKSVLPMQRLFQIRKSVS